jgi:hypothetical protein
MLESIQELFYSLDLFLPLLCQERRFVGGGGLDFRPGRSSGWLFELP